MRSTICIVFLCLTSALFAQHTINLTLEAPVGKGTILIAVYGSEADFDNNENAVAQGKVVVNKIGSYQTTLTDIPSGKYVIALFQDVNDNGKLDSNFLGIPKEPYAFSRSPKVKWRAPKYEEVVFDLQSSQDMKLVLKKWKKR
ncbi:MAG: DUF2141 domain-containing protein [Saprospiraceae bacterium]|nr:DUF2141 domain-containing protein [Saprospiraceae bacterium]